MLELDTFCFSFFLFLISQVLREAVVSPLGMCVPGGPESSGSPRVGRSCGSPRWDTGEHTGSAPAPPSAFLVLFLLLSFGFRETVAQRAGSCFCCPSGWAWLPPSSWRRHCPSPGISSQQWQLRDEWGTQEMLPSAPLCRDLGGGAAEPLQPVFANEVLLAPSHTHSGHRAEKLRLRPCNAQPKIFSL